MQNTLRDIIEHSDMGIVLSDGCRLSARVWMPRDAHENPVPVILEYLPYRKRDGTTARDALTHPYFAKRGYACVRVDMRGNGDSEGIMEDEYTETELSDGVEVINWLADQPWCSGAVGMMGISWGGFNGLQIAERAPKPLKAVITLCSTVDRYADDIHYKGGCLLNENFGWGSTMWAYSSRAPDPALVGDKWRDMWMQRLKAEAYLPVTWLKHQTRDEYWKHGSVCENYSGIKAAVLAIGGWGDAYKNTISHLVENLEAPVKGIVGPWVHKYPHFAVPEPRIGFLQEALRWWDRWLKGIQTGVDEDPAYSVYLVDGVRPKAWYEHLSGRWVNEPNWPIGPKMETFHLNGNNTLSSKQMGPFENMVRSPQHCGLASGEYCAIWLGPELPSDQRVDDSMSQCFDSSELSKDMDIIGAPVIHLKLKSSEPQAQIFVRFNHVHPDGASTRVTYGVFNLTHLLGHDKVSNLEPNKEFNVTFKLDQIAYCVPKGHKIRIAVSNSYWPLIWPMSQHGDLTIVQGHVDVPVSEHDKKDERVFPAPEADELWDISVIRETSNGTTRHY